MEKQVKRINRVKSNGIYSVLNDEWIKKPIQEDIPDIDKSAFNKEFKQWKVIFDTLISNTDLGSKKIAAFIEKLYDLRKESIAKDGEYGLGNLIFKEFRNRGYLDQLKDLKNRLKSKELSLEQLQR